MTPILGPCPCQGCDALVWWARGGTWNKPKTWVARWRDANGRTHRCKP